MRTLPRAAVSPFARSPAASYTAIAWNLRTGTPALRDVRVRIALAYAIDVDVASTEVEGNVESLLAALGLD